MKTFPGVLVALFLAAGANSQTACAEDLFTQTIVLVTVLSEPSSYFGRIHLRAADGTYSYVSFQKTSDLAYTAISPTHWQSVLTVLTTTTTTCHLYTLYPYTTGSNLYYFHADSMIAGRF